MSDASATADLRTVHGPDGLLYVVLSDIGAMLLDTAQTVEAYPGLSAADVLRSLAKGIGAYEEAPHG